MTGLAHTRRDATAVVVDAAIGAGIVSRPLSAVGVLLMASGAAVWTVVIASLAVWRHDQFLSHRFDLGNMVQAVWSTAEGRPLEATDGQTGEQVVRLGGHVDPALILFVPLWWIHSAPESLIVGQAAALAAGIYPVVRLALKYTGSGLAAALLGTWYLAFPWLVWNAFNDVHAVTLAIPFLMYAIWFLDQHHLGRFAVFGVLAMSTGELVGLTVAALGVWYALRYRRRWAGLAIALGGTAWAAICVLVVVPAFNAGRPSRYYSLFESVGGSPRGLLVTLFTDPATVLAQVTTSTDALYGLLLLVPTAFLALGQPLLLAAVLPQLGVNTLSASSATTYPVYQYVSAIVPILVATSIMTIGRFHGRLRLVAAALPVVAALMCLAWKPPLPGEDRWVFDTPDSDARTAAMREAIELVPPDAPVSVTNRLGAHLSARREIYLFPDRVDAEWAVIDTRDSDSYDVHKSQALLVGGAPFDQRPYSSALASLARDPGWRLVYDLEDVRVYRRSS